MGRRRRGGVMSEQLKVELAKESKDAGNMVKRAIQIAEQTAARSGQP
jgi:small acid-soluble spore protein F (minor alpha/beta-type SASP)